jgi:hypothetical protein
MVEAAGLEPRSDLQHNHAETRQNPALSQQNPSTSTHEKCVPSVSKNPDLDQVVAAWDDLPNLVKARILELVKIRT